MQFRLVPAAAIGALALFILISFSSVSIAANAPTVQEYDLSPNVSVIDAMAIDHSGNVWMVDTAASTLYKFNVTSIAFEEHALPSISGSHYTGISVDDTGVVWMADKGGNRILGYGEKDNKYYRYDFPQNLQLEPAAVLRSDHYLWIPMSMELGRLDITDPNVPLTDYYVYSHVADLSDVKMDGAGNMWFVEYNAGKVGNLLNGHDETIEYTIPTSNSYPTCMDIDSQKRVWFVESQPNKLGMFDAATNSFREFPAPVIDGLQSTLNRIAVDGDDNVWLSDTANGRLIKYYPAKNVSVPVYVGDNKSYPTFMSIDSDGIIWVVESGTKKLAKVNADSLYGISGTVTPTVTPTPTAAASNQTATATAKPSPGFEMIAGISALLVALCLAQRKK